MAETGQKKYELASPEFVNAFREFMQKQLANEKLDGVTFDYSWVATNAPAHILKSAPANTYGPGVVGWSWSIRNGKVDVGGFPFPPEKNDFWLKSSYDQLRKWIKLTDAEDAVFMGQKPRSDGSVVNEMQKFIDAGELELHYDKQELIPVIGKYIVLSDWRDSFFSKRVA